MVDNLARLFVAFLNSNAPPGCKRNIYAFTTEFFGSGP